MNPHCIEHILICSVSPVQGDCNEYALFRAYFRFVPYLLVREIAMNTYALLRAYFDLCSISCSGRLQ